MVIKRVQGWITGPWKEFVDTEEGSDVCLTQFLVSTDAAGAPFTTIQAAYAAAEAAGHNAANPAQVLVCPGTYSGPLTLGTPGIDIIGVAQDSQRGRVFGGSGDGQTVFTGNIVVDPVSAGTRDSTSIRWQGIDVKPTTGIGFNVAGPNNAALYLYITDCQVVSPDDEPIRITNTGVDGFTASVVDVQRCRVETQEANANAVAIFGVGFPLATLAAAHTAFLGGTTGAAMRLAAGQSTVDSCYLFGGTDAILSAGTLLALDTVFEALGPASAITIDGTSLARVTDCKFDADQAAGPFITGTGLFIHDGLTFLGTGVPPFDTALTVSTSQAIPLESHNQPIILDGTSFEITSETNLVVEASPAGGTIVLPPSGARPGVLRLKLGENNAGVVTVSQQGADDIRLGGAAPVLTFPLTDDGVFLVSTPPSRRWEGWVFGGGGTSCLTQYLVSPSAATAPFQSIQLAVDAAVLAGADPLSPAKVLVCPGTYFENVTLSQPGVHVVGVAMDDYNTLRTAGLGITRLEGTLTIDLVAGIWFDEQRNVAWRGIDIATFQPCIAEGSQVATPRGSRPIESLRVGDEVLSVDPESGERHVTKVKGIRTETRECMEMSTSGESLVCTPVHPIYSPERGDYQNASRWADGELSQVLRLTDGGVTAEEVQATSRDAGMRQVFDISVESPLLNFVANGFVVHNKTVAVVFSGVNFQQAFITDCLLSANFGDPAVLGTNTGVGLQGFSRLDCIRVRLENTDAASASGFDWLKGWLRLNDCQTSGQVSNTIGDGLLPRPEVEAVGCIFRNGTTINEGDFFVTDCSFPGDAVAFAGVSDFETTRCDMPAGSVVGPAPGVFTYDYLSNTFFQAPIDPAIDVIQKESIPAGSEVVQFAGPGPFVLTGGYTNVLVTTIDQPLTTLTLPLILAGASRRHGPIRVKNSINSITALTVDVPAGVKLNEVLAGTAVLAPGTSITVCAINSGLIGPDWETF